MINFGYIRQKLFVLLTGKMTSCIYSVLSPKSYRNTNILVYMYFIFLPNQREILSNVPTHYFRNTIAKGFLNHVINLIRSFIRWVFFNRIFPVVA